MPHQAAHVVAARTRRDIHGAAIRASLAIRVARSALSQLRAVTNCASVSDSLATSASPGRGGQIFQHQHRFADCREMAVAFDDAVHENGASAA